MQHPPTGVLATPLPSLALDEPFAVGLAALVLALTAFFALLRVALLRSVPERVLERVPDERRRARLRPLLGVVESLATSASVFELAGQLVFVLLVYGLVSGATLGWGALGLALAVAVPLLLLASEVLPAALGGAIGDSLLVRCLPTFALVQRPVAALVLVLELLRRGTMRVLRVRERPRSTRRIVEGLRDAIDDAELDEDLDETEREIIENVLEFHDVDVAEIMTPRTEIHAVERADGLDGVVRSIAEHGHHRVPVYDGSLDRIVGAAHAQDVIELVARGELDGASLGDTVRPVSFVPETKLVSELLAEFKSDPRKLAVVLDEYGGTAGLVTVQDVLDEIVGDMREEHGEAEPDPIRRRADGGWVVDASTHVSDVNEELELELPEEEDFETLAGFVLAELGRLPREGESFEHAGHEFAVLSAGDRRILEIGVRRVAPAERAG